MPTPLTIDFSDLSTTGIVHIPENYKGFHWASYQMTQTFHGPVVLQLLESETEVQARPISSMGFQITSNTGNSFDLTSLSITRTNGYGQLDVTLKAIAFIPEGQIEVASLVIKSSVSEDTGGGLFNVHLKNIYQLQIYSNTMEKFDVKDIKVILN